MYSVKWCDGDMRYIVSNDIFWMEFGEKFNNRYKINDLSVKIKCLESQISSIKEDYREAHRSLDNRINLIDSKITSTVNSKVCEVLKDDEQVKDRFQEVNRELQNKLSINAKIILDECVNDSGRRQLMDQFMDNQKKYCEKKMDSLIRDHSFEMNRLKDKLAKHNDLTIKIEKLESSIENMHTRQTFLLVGYLVLFVSGVCIYISKN